MPSSFLTCLKEQMQMGEQSLLGNGCLSQGVRFFLPGSFESLTIWGFWLDGPLPVPGDSLGRFNKAKQGFASCHQSI